jgi:hypothetical protein
VKVLPFPDS